MTEFATDGVTIAANAGPAGQPSYAVQSKPKLKRVALACFLCAISACIGVAIIGAIGLFAISTVKTILGMPNSIFTGSTGFWDGTTIALGMSAMNWWLFYITIPAAWMALGFSLGFMPRRGIRDRGPYIRWGAIWGAILVGATTLIMGALIGGASNTFASLASLPFAAGAGLTGALVGALAGAACGGLFIAIVRPAEQIGRIAVDVF